MRLGVALILVAWVAAAQAQLFRRAPSDEQLRQMQIQGGACAMPSREEMERWSATRRRCSASANQLERAAPRPLRRGAGDSAMQALSWEAVGGKIAIKPQLAFETVLGNAAARHVDSNLVGAGDGAPVRVRRRGLLKRPMNTTGAPNSRTWSLKTRGRGFESCRARLQYALVQGHWRIDKLQVAF